MRYSFAVYARGYLWYRCIFCLTLSDTVTAIVIVNSKIVIKLWPSTVMVDESSLTVWSIEYGFRCGSLCRKCRECSTRRLRLRCSITNVSRPNVNFSAVTHILWDIGERRSKLLWIVEHRLSSISTLNQWSLTDEYSINRDLGILNNLHRLYRTIYTLMANRY